MDAKRNVALIVTGSIAAIKTIPLIDVLRRNGHDVSVILTRAPEEWKWVAADAIKAATGHAPLTHRSSLEERERVLLSSQTILIAPTSASFLSQLAHTTSPLAESILNAHTQGRTLMIAPAMNFKMWEHPAVLRNAKTLYDAGAVFLGPVKGPLACGDEGYGRMIDIEDMAASLDAAENSRSHPALSFPFAIRQSEESKEKTFCLKNPVQRILLLLGGDTIPWDELRTLWKELAETRLETTVIAEPSWTAHREDIENLIGQPLITEHYECPGLDGMEHIKLPERSRCVFLPFIDRAFAEKLARGEANSLCLGTYLASKVPVVTRDVCLKNLPEGLASTLQHDGILRIHTVRELAEP